MKKIITLLFAVLISTATFAQKKELKLAEKSLEANNFTEALSLLNSSKSLFDTAKDKYKTQYYFLLGKALYANGTAPEKYGEVANAFNTLMDLEKSGSKKYTVEAQALLNAMIQKVADKASTGYNDAIAANKEGNKDKATHLFSDAAADFKQVYQLSVQDTAFLQNSALASYFAQDYQESVTTYQDLLDTGYTGISTTYIAKSVLNGNKIGYQTKEEMDKQVKLKLASDPEVIIRESQRNEIIKMIAKNYIAMKDNDKALTAIHKAQKASPNDYGLLVDEANVYYAMGNNTKFQEKLEQAVKINPSDPILYYNIGVMKMELKDIDGAVSSFEKAIELNPTYADAYNNIGAALLEKVKPIVEQMNQNLSNFDKYDQLQAQQMEVYKKALPYYEKVYEMDSSRISVVQTLMGIYENLEMGTKAKEMRAVYNSMK